MPLFSRAALEIVSPTHSGSAISGVLGLDPTVEREATDSAPTLWRLDVAGATALDDLVAALHGKAAELRALREHFSTTIVLSDSTLLEVSAQTLSELALSGCDIRVDQDSAPVIERAELPVRPGLEAEFELAFAVARHLVEETPGCRAVSLSRGIESPGRYLLLIEWDSVESHEIGFRQSSRYEQWRALLHHFYEPFPTVEHFSPVHRRADD